MGFSFSDHVALLEQFLAGRQRIVDDIDRRLLNVRGKAITQETDRGCFDEIFISCFFESPAALPQASRFKGQLAAAHLAEGFDPGPADGYSREVDPVSLVLHAHRLWDRDRWPGRTGRLAYAQSLYAVFILRQLAYLSLRIWDEGDHMAAERLEQVQQLLDLLNGASTAPLVRDARWLIQIAQGPLTKHVKPYSVVADRVARSLRGGAQPDHRWTGEFQRRVATHPRHKIAHLLGAGTREIGLGPLGNGERSPHRLQLRERADVLVRLLQRLPDRRQILRADLRLRGDVRQRGARPAKRDTVYTVVLKDGTELVLSRAFRSTVEQWLQQPL
jgi:hypothetical protein